MNFFGESLTIAADKVLTKGQDAVIVTADAVMHAKAGAQTILAKEGVEK